MIRVLALSLLAVVKSQDCATGNVPSGAGFGTECDSLVDDSTCTQFCTTGYSDNNNDSGQAYTCPGGTFTISSALLTCSGIIQVIIPSLKTIVLFNRRLFVRKFDDVFAYRTVCISYT